MKLNRENEIAITATGIVSNIGIGLAAHARALFEVPVDGGILGGPMTRFNALPHLSDRKMMKAVSSTDAIGLVAIENLKQDLKVRCDESESKKNPATCGFYVGAPSAFASDNENYLGAVASSADYENNVSLARFGHDVMASRPNTLLIGLPNNVLCYGSMLLGIQGPNSNYTSGEMSGVIALVAAARRLRRGQVDRAIAGAFTAMHERIISKTFDYYGVGNGASITTDAGAFVALERSDAIASDAAEPITTLLGFGFGSSGISLNFSADSHSAVNCVVDESIEDAIKDAIEVALTDAGINPENVGLILAGSTGIPAVDRREFLVLSRVFAKGRTCPALGSLSTVMGNMMEAGGLLELMIGGEIWRRGGLPDHLKPKMDLSTGLTKEFEAVVDPASEKITLIVRTSPWGEAAALVVRY